MNFKTFASENHNNIYKKYYIKHHYIFIHKQLSKTFIQLSQDVVYNCPETTRNDWHVGRFTHLHTFFCFILYQHLQTLADIIICLEV
jgi:hypothetical protein